MDTEKTNDVTHSQYPENLRPTSAARASAGSGRGVGLQAAADSVSDSLHGVVKSEEDARGSVEFNSLATTMLPHDHTEVMLTSSEEERRNSVTKASKAEVSESVLSAIDVGVKSIIGANSKGPESSRRDNEDTSGFQGKLVKSSRARERESVEMSRRRIEINVRRSDSGRDSGDNYTSIKLLGVNFGLYTSTDRSITPRDANTRGLGTGIGDRGECSTIVNGCHGVRDHEETTVEVVTNKLATSENSIIHDAWASVELRAISSIAIPSVQVDMVVTSRKGPYNARFSRAATEVVTGGHDGSRGSWASECKSKSVIAVNDEGIVAS